MIEEFAPAKVNLALHVLGRRADGFHELDGMVVFADVGDVLKVEPAAEFVLEVTGPFAGDVPTGPENLVMRAARALSRTWPEHFAPVRVRLEKNLPVASGLGGGSADAAAALRAMIRIAGRTPPESDLRALALELGADVPVCLAGHPCRMRGVGEVVEPIDGLAPLHGVLVNPGVPVSTPRVFSGLGLRPGSAHPDVDPAVDRLVAAARKGSGALMEALAKTENHLQSVACLLHPAIDRCLQALREAPDVLLARMSGSGATCFALTESAGKARKLCDLLREKHAEWWVESAVFGVSGNAWSR